LVTFDFQFLIKFPTKPIPPAFPLTPRPLHLSLSLSLALSQSLTLSLSISLSLLSLSNKPNWSGFRSDRAPFLSVETSLSLSLPLVCLSVRSVFHLEQFFHYLASVKSTWPKIGQKNRFLQHFCKARRRLKNSVNHCSTERYNPSWLNLLPINGLARKEIRKFEIKLRRKTTKTSENWKFHWSSTVCMRVLLNKK
jgi:hypothetical protein